ncbi:DUF2939 domain-containing protein [Bradyrhizobium sp.]|jgi:hypothetical protein|uniref:DUF2939 domain-containing protein n=1 Tax=Bradyrhizobium sp. TaxID=376 RepID=UPI002E0259EB|nr:DUF2939 domain-containing protein [Bradyrhizobium sp.]
MRWLIGIVIIVLVSLVVYAGSAVWSAKNLVEAVRSGNAGEILARTDVPRVKRSLTDQILAAYLDRLGAKRPIKPLERMLANTYGASIADALVSKLLTEENLTRLLRTGAVGDVSQNAQAGNLASLANLEPSALRLLGRISPINLVEVAILLGDDRDSGAVHLHFEGDGWKLSGIQLPVAALRALVESLPMK